MTLALDHNVPANGTSTTSIAGTITAAAGDWIVAVVAIFTSNTLTGSGASAVSQVNGNKDNGSALDFGIRKRLFLTTSSSSKPLIVEIWAAFCATGVTSQSITASLVGGGTQNNTMELVSISGADQLYPWDTNSSLPATDIHAGSGGSANHTVTFSTTDSDTIALAVLAAAFNLAGGTPAADSGFTLLDRASSSTLLTELSEYEVYNSVKTSLAQNVWASESSVTTNYIALIDAMRKPEVSPTWNGPKFVNTGGSTRFSGVFTASLNYPSNLVVGNLLVAIAYESASVINAQFPAGWTTVNLADATTSQTITLAWRIVDGSEGASITVSNLGATSGWLQMMQYNNVAIANQLTNVHVNWFSSTTALTCTAITTTADNSLAVGYLGTGVAGGGMEPPAHYMSRSSFYNTTNLQATFHSFDEAIPTHGTTADSLSQTFWAATGGFYFTFEVLAPYPVGSLTTTEAADVLAATGSVGPRLDVREHPDTFAADGFVLGMNITEAPDTFKGAGRKPRRIVVIS